MDTVGGHLRLWDSGVLSSSPVLSSAFQCFPGNQAIHPLQKGLTAGLALFALVLGFGEGNLIHGRESCAVGQNRIIAYFGKLFRASLSNS